MYLLASHLNTEVEGHYNHSHHNVGHCQRYDEVVGDYTIDKTLIIIVFI